MLLISTYKTHRYQWYLKKMTPVEYRGHLLVRLTIFVERIFQFGEASPSVEHCK
ncbi:IS3 family transposase [Sporosarcina sp. BP05]|uniref:IS3 family transposase n=1 Tax=Sporosarcina sp. BP05 TaxID=2758726 RepID=UPI00351C0E51